MRISDWSSDVCSSDLNIFSVIGLIMLMGLVTKNAILLIDFVNQARSEGRDRATAILEAGEIRLRPIVMTTMAMNFGMMPLPLGLGDGARPPQAMAHEVIGGLIGSVARRCGERCVMTLI